ncbi:LuxR family two component transcriptional regulator [Tahibacter aquaticus]|uniref:LuxR family two component transcriptional regulator n=1 Tax=Tahibacter aquaticus TaxID=520092 RepID=A0A4R6Z0V8_9GAMM|nr:response regulator transcription factor [Tahibacter aquaticus]TDR45009.1 LuxR family two component transcriptional regulator [Tahibacter aquaticus]
MKKDVVRIRVLLADDHPVMRDGLRAAIESAGDMDVVGEAGDGVEAVARFQQCQPDVSVLDIQMPLLDGLQAIAQIRALDAAARIVVLTTYPGDARAKKALASGAIAYLLKSSTREEILNAIRAAAQGRGMLSAEVASDVALHAGADMLTGRELAVLQLVATGHSNKEIAEKLTVADDTVKARLQSAMVKLGASDRAHAVTLAVKRGFLDR